MSNPILKVENLFTGYGNKPVLYDVSFNINKGEIVLLAGSNGSGKSTLLKAIYGILPLWKNSETGNAGRIIFDSKNITGIPTAKLLKKGILYIPQKNNLFEDLTVKENLEIAGLNIDRKILKQRMENTFEIFKELTHLLNRISMKLSGGEKRLLTLAMANLHEPKMIMIDEPFAGLSPQNISHITENFRLLNEKRGISILIVEHRIKESILIAKKIIGLKLGKVYCGIDVERNNYLDLLKSLFT